MWIFEIKQDIASMRRFWFILEKLSTYGFHEFTDFFPRTHKWRKPGAARKLDGKSRPEKLRMLVEELGPTFIKLGQILSTREDLIPAAYAKELTHLTEHVPGFPYEEVKKIIREELGKEVEELYSEFSQTPLAAASIGQAHKAVLPDGTAVVVKIQRPGIRDVIEQDLTILRYIAERWQEYDCTVASYRPVEIIDSFAASLRKELNYEYEAANMSRFARDMASCKGVTAPKVYSDHSSRRVLTMECIQGDSAARVMAHPELREKYDLVKIAENGVKSLMSQIFEHGFFHADPHPGNIFLRGKSEICFIDFGMVGRVTEKERSDFLRVLSHMLKNEITPMVDTALHMTVTGRLQGSRSAFERDLADLVDVNINQPLEKLSVARVLEELLDTLSRYKVALKPDLYLMCKALITVEHVGRSFDPKLQIVELVKPFLTRMKLRTIDPRPIAGRIIDNFEENIYALESLPRQLHAVMARMETGETTLRVEHHRLDDIEQTLYITGERVSRALMITALLLGSALVIVAKLPPYWQGIPLIGGIGFFISAFLSILIICLDHAQRRRFLKERAMRKLRRENEQRS